MTNEDKRVWLDWAVGIGLIEFKEFSDLLETEILYQSWWHPTQAEIAEIDKGCIYIYDRLEFAIKAEIDKRGWLLTQEDVAQWDRERQSFVIKHDCYIRYVDIQTSKFIGEAHEAESRLDALMEAFRESVEAN